MKTPENTLSLTEMLSVAGRVARAVEREESCSIEQLRQRKNVARCARYMITI